MGSRLKQNPERTFYWFFEATCPVARDKDPGVLFQFPEDFSDEESCQMLPRFCFPYDIQRARTGVAVQHFTFVLTDLEGCQRFGFCRINNSTHTCLCILSYLPWFEVFYKLLNSLADYLTKGQTNEIKALLAALYKQPVPLAAGSVTLQMGEQLLVTTEVSHPVGHPEGQEGVPYFIAPDPRSLPSIPENRNLTELIVAVDVGNLLQVYACMLFERRILIFASKLSTLTSCVHALSAVLYPMYWQHIFIPVLPPHLLDYCCAPMPYLIGVHTSLSERVRSRGLEEVVILNVDTNTLETPFDDLKSLPADVMSELKLCLKRQAVSPGCGVSWAFLRAQAQLFGGYRDALHVHEGDEIRFSEKMFLEHKSPSMRQFLQGAVHLQFFKQFIDDRLDILNKGEEPDDQFEEAILKCETTAGMSKSYQQFVGHLKKGGGALILNMKSKANMRAKGLAKSGLKNLLMNKTQNGQYSLQRVGSVSHHRAQSDCLQNRLPITHHFGMSRPRRPVHKFRAPRDQDNGQSTGDAWDGAVTESAGEPDPEPQKDEEEEAQDSLLCDPEEMDLLGEIFETLSSRSSHERGLLYGTRSLDLFGPDCHDYITKFGPITPSQESLCLSNSGSGSLHSWNVETTEELSDVMEDSDWLRPDFGTREEVGSESPLAICQIKEQERGGEAEERKDEAKTTNHCREVMSEDGQEEGFGKEPLKEKREDGGLRETSGEVTERHRETNEKDVAGDKGKDPDQDDKENDRTTASNKLVKLSPHDSNMVGSASPESSASSGCQSPISADPQPPAASQTREDTARKSEQALGHTPSPPEAMKSPSSQETTRTEGSEEPGRTCDVPSDREKRQIQRAPSRRSNTSEENNCPVAFEKEDHPLIKVSQLKKRFES